MKEKGRGKGERGREKRRGMRRKKGGGRKEEEERRGRKEKDGRYCLEGLIYPAGLKLWSSIVKRKKFWLTAPFQAEKLECDPQSVSWVSQGSGRRSKRGVREE